MSYFYSPREAALEEILKELKKLQNLARIVPYQLEGMAKLFFVVWQGLKQSSYHRQDRSMQGEVGGVLPHAMVRLMVHASAILLGYG